MQTLKDHTHILGGSGASRLMLHFMPTMGVCSPRGMEGHRGPLRLFSTLSLPQRPLGALVKHRLWGPSPVSDSGYWQGVGWGVGKNVHF